MGKVIGALGAAFVAIVGLTILFGSWYTVEQGERAVLLTNGRLVSVEDPGLHFKTPWFQSVRKIDVRQQTAYWGFEGTEGAMQAYSKDQQAADLRVSLNWRVPIDKVADVYSTYGGIQGLAGRTVVRFAPEAAKEIFGQYTAVRVVAERAQFNAQVEAAIKASVEGYPIIVDSVQIENIDFSEAYEQAVEARMTAEVAVAKEQQNLDREKKLADIAIEQARGRAESAKQEGDAKAYAIRAEGEANAFKLKAEGEATAAAIEARAKALGSNPLLVELTKAEQWTGQLPTTMIPGGAVPFLNLSTGGP